MTALAKRAPELWADEFLKLPIAEQRAYIERNRPQELTGPEFLALEPAAREAHMQALHRHNWRHVACLRNEIKHRITIGELVVPDRVRRMYGLKPAAHQRAASIDGAIQRAHAREAQKAQHTPRHLWTPAMAEAVRRQEPESKARR